MSYHAVLRGLLIVLASIFEAAGSAFRTVAQYEDPAARARREWITASVLAAEMGDGKQYGSSRDFVASIGLVPHRPHDALAHAWRLRGPEALR